MTDLEFQSDDNKNLRDCIKVLENHCGQIELISYGLAPNPFGFCYEIIEGSSGTINIRTIENALDSLNSDQEEVIKGLYLR
jgi:hypothetical protein